MNKPSTNPVRRSAASHLSTLAVVGIFATLSLTAIAIWSTHERTQHGSVNNAPGDSPSTTHQVDS